MRRWLLAAALLVALGLPGGAAPDLGVPGPAAPRGAVDPGHALEDTAAPGEATGGASTARAPAPGDVAPGFALPDLHGQRVSLEQFRGRPVVLTFWACWCDTWKDASRRLKELRRTHPHLGFEAFFVAVDSRTRTLAEPLLLREGVPFPVALDVRGEVSRRYGVTVVPTLFVVDARGMVRFVHQSYPGNRVLARELASCASPVRSLPPQDLESLLLPEERDLWARLNAERAARGLAPLAFEPALTEVGREYLQRRVGEPLSHAAPETPEVRLRARGLRYAKVGENLARAATPQGALRAMLESPLHKANLLSPAFRKGGVAAVREGPSRSIYCVLLAGAGREPTPR